MTVTTSNMQPVKMYGSLNTRSRRIADEARKLAREEEEEAGDRADQRRAWRLTLRRKVLYFNPDHWKRPDLIRASDLAADIPALKAQARHWGITLKQAMALAAEGAARKRADRLADESYDAAYDRVMTARGQDDGMILGA